MYRLNRRLPSRCGIRLHVVDNPLPSYFHGNARTCCAISVRLSTKCRIRWLRIVHICALTAQALMTYVVRLFHGLYYIPSTVGKPDNPDIQRVTPVTENGVGTRCIDHTEQLLLSVAGVTRILMTYIKFKNAPEIFSKRCLLKDDVIFLLY